MVGLGGFALSSRSPGPTTGTTTNQTPSPAAPSATADATELTKTYISGQHGYSISYPDGWTVTPAAATWLVGKVTNWGSPALDVIEGADTRLVASSQPLATGQSPEAWYQAYCAGGQEVTNACRDYATTWAPIAIGSAMGYVDLDGVPALQGSIKPGGPLFDAVVVTDGRGYKFTLDGAGDRALFEHLLASVTIIAATASPLDHVSSTFTSPLYDYSIAVDPAWTTTPATEVINSPKSTDENCCDQIADHRDRHDDQSERRPAERQVRRRLSRKTPTRAWRPTPRCRPVARAGIPAHGRPWRSATQRGVVTTLCNFAVVYVNVGDRMYAFEWGHQTFDAVGHLTFADFEQLLATVRFAGT